METTTVAVIAIFILALLIGLKLPIGFALGLTGGFGLVIISGIDQGLALFASRPINYSSTYALSCIPLFIIMGYFTLYGGMSRDLYDFFYKWVGRLAGGLAIATTGACAVFAACTGSSTASIAALGEVCIPEMKKHKYNGSLYCGALAAAGTLGMLIPPSIIAAIYAIIVEVSIGKQLIAGIIPGIISVLVYWLMLWARTAVNPRLGPPAVGITWKDSFRSVWKVWGGLFVFVLILGGIYAGVFTPTEAGAIGASGCLFVAIVKKGMNWSKFKKSLVESTKVMGMIAGVLIGSGIFSLFISVSGFTREVAQFISGLHMSPLTLVGAILLFYIPLGMFIDNISMVLLTVPIFYPILVDAGVDLIWFGVLVIKMCEIGLITPPFGFNVYLVSAIDKEVSIETIFKGIGWFVAMDLVAVIILMAFPQLCTWLPSMMLK